MGTSIWIRSSNRNLDEKYCKEKGTLKLSLSKSYNDFASGYEAVGENCDFAQIQEIFEIDLSPFRIFNHAGMGNIEEEEESYRDYLLKKAKTELEKEKIIEDCISNIKSRKISEAKLLKENWVLMDKLKSTIISLQRKMKSNQELFKKIDFKIMNKRNFIPNPFEEKKALIKNREEHLKKVESNEFGVNILFEKINVNKKISPEQIEFIKNAFVKNHKTMLEKGIKSLKEGKERVSAYDINEDFKLMLEFIEYATKRGENKIAFYIM